jgi:hypothetical protein
MKVRPVEAGPAFFRICSFSSGGTNSPNNEKEMENTNTPHIKLFVAAKCEDSQFICAFSFVEMCIPNAVVGDRS